MNTLHNLTVDRPDERWFGGSRYNPLHKLVNGARFTPRKGAYYEFKQNPVAMRDTGAAWSTATAHVNFYQFPGFMFEALNIVGNRNLPVMTATGLNVNDDDTNTRGLQIDPGILANNQQAFKVGTDGAFYFRLKSKVADVSGTNPYAIGFRQAAARNAAIGELDNIAYVDIGGTGTDDKKMRFLSKKAAGVTTTADIGINWADGATKDVLIKVDSSGAVSVQVDGADASIDAYTFTDETVVIPFIHIVNGAETAGDIELIEWDCGLFL